MREKKSHGVDPKKIHEKGYSFTCPKCGIAFSTKIDLNNHNCDGDVKTEKEPKKTPVPLHLFKKPALKDELDMLKSMREKKH